MFAELLTLCGIPVDAFWLSCYLLEEALSVCLGVLCFYRWHLLGEIVWVLTWSHASSRVCCRVRLADA